MFNVLFFPQSDPAVGTLTALVRYTGFATSREIGPALAGFTPLMTAALVTAAGGAPWLVAAYLIALCPVSLVAFFAAPEMKDIDIADAGPAGAR